MLRNLTEGGQVFILRKCTERSLYCLMSSLHAIESSNRRLFWQRTLLELDMMPPGERSGTPYNNQYGEASTERGTFLRHRIVALKMDRALEVKDCFTSEHC